MKYYRMTFSQANAVTSEVWRRQDAACLSPTAFHFSASGTDTSVWTESPDGEKLLRRVLDDLGISYEEGEEQQVRTWLDAFH